MALKFEKDVTMGTFGPLILLLWQVSNYTAIFAELFLKFLSNLVFNIPGPFFVDSLAQTMLNCFFRWEEVIRIPGTVFC
jgi:hypothetical protein